MCQLFKMRGGVPCILILLVACVHPSQAKDYYMDNMQDCGFIGTLTIQGDETVRVYAKTTDTSTSRQGGCTINFMASDMDSTIQLDFASYINRDCTVKLQLSGGGTMKEYTCGDNPSSYFTLERTLGITLYKPGIEALDYNFVLSIRQVFNDRYPPPDDSNPAAVGLIAGLASGVFGVIVIVSVIGICCFRKYKVRGSTKSPFFHDQVKTDLNGTSTTMSVGYTNENMHGSPMAKKKLLSHSDSSHSDEKYETNNQRPRTLNLRGRNYNQGPNYPSKVNMPPAAPPPPPAPPVGYNGRADLKGSQSDGSYSSNERGIDVEPHTPKNEMLGALRSNSKFQNSFKSNERDAENRAKRISSSSFDKFGEAPSPPSSDEGNRRPTLPPVPKSPKSKKSKHAKINRQPRPTSMSSEEIAQIEKGTPENGEDTNIKVLHDNSMSSSGSEVVPIKLNKEEKKRKPDTTHSLRPDRKTGRGKKKPTQSVSSAIDPEPKSSPRGRRDRIESADSQLDERPRTQRDRLVERDQNDSSFEKMGSGRYSKGKGRKSPRPGKSSGRGFSHRRGRSMDHLDSRPTTPISAYGSMEDLESLPPLQRASSKNSLYASRSSLYDRRRRRKGSGSESVVSYRDDMSVHRHSRGYESYSDDDDFDGYEKPLSRRDRDRMYRSENDLGRRVKEISTQTLRETATQTGPNESVTMQEKRLVKKKRRPRSVSSSGTQTVKKETKTKSRSTDRLDEKGVDKSDKSEKRKTKRSKSSNALDDLEGDTEKPKTKPKPKPRKSTSADTHLEDNPISASQENLADKNPYYPQSEGFQPQLQYPQGYPMMPPAPPGYQGQPGVPPQQYPQYPMNGVPQGYPGYMGVPPAPQTMQQGPPHMSGGPLPPNQQSGIPRQRNKSNWEMLCEMTDGNRVKDDITETGSVASSVFTNYGNPSGNPYYGNQQFHNNYAPPPGQGHSYPPQGNQNIPDYENADYRAKSVQQSPRVQPDNPVKTQSSWDKLQDITGQPTTKQNPPAVRNTRSESVV